MKMNEFERASQSPLFEDGVGIRLVSDEAYLPACLHLIKTARYRVWLSQFLIDGRADRTGTERIRELCHALGEASHRGLSVRVLVDDLRRAPWGEELNAPGRRFLEARGVETRVFRPAMAGKRSLRRHLHGKTVIVDDVFGLVGSHDLTPNGLFGPNREMSVIIGGRDPVRWLSNWFEDLWHYSKASHDDT